MSEFATTAAATEALQPLLARSATDREFRQQLLTSPRAAIAEFTGRAVPESMDIRFVENTAGATFVLPDAVSAGAELTENELEAVAGGVIPLVPVAIAIFCGFVAGATSSDN